MTNPNAAWITLDSVIIDYLEASEQSNHKYIKCFNLAFRGMDFLGLDFFYAVKSVKLPVELNKTVKLPSDYITYSKVGVLNNSGEVVVLQQNEKFTSYAALLPDRKEKTNDPTLPNTYNLNTPFFYNFWGYGYFAPLYGDYRDWETDRKSTRLNSSH